MVLRALHRSIDLSSEEFWDTDHYNLIFHTENQNTDTLDNLLKVTHLMSYEAWLQIQEVQLQSPGSIPYAISLS